MISDVGFSDIINTLYNKYNYIAIGTGSTPASATDTILESETQRLIATKSKSTTTRTNDTITMYSLFTISSSTTLNEVGLFSASSAGDMFTRIVEPVVVQSGYQMRATIEIIVSETDD